METISIHQAKMHLSKLVERAARGESFVIAKAGKPMAKVVPLDNAGVRGQRLGFMVGEIDVPDDFDRMGGGAIEGMFAGER